MKVKELIKCLEMVNQDLEVIIDGDDIGFFDIVKIDKFKLQITKNKYQEFCNLISSNES